MNNRKTRRAFAALYRRKKLRLMKPLVSREDFAFLGMLYPERF